MKWSLILYQLFILNHFNVLYIYHETPHFEGHKKTKQIVRLKYLYNAPILNGA